MEAPENPWENPWENMVKIVEEVISEEMVNEENAGIWAEIVNRAERVEFMDVKIRSSSMQLHNLLLSLWSFILA